jgi:formylmethanofuran dehydrogenase subunit E
VKTPDFYDLVDPIRLRDPLSGFLGATEKGATEVRYIDAVRLAGHSCPTVAGAWLMARCALKELYGHEIPVRGEIQVQMAEALETGVCGVISTVFSLITGAAAGGGFQGLAGKFNRRDLLSFGHEAPGPDRLQGVARFTRRDSGRTVTVDYDHSAVPADPDMMPLMQKSLGGQATPGEEARFAELWTARVRAILNDHGDSLVTVRTEEN